MRVIVRKQSAFSGGIHEIVCVLPDVVNKRLQGGWVRNRFIPLIALPNGRDGRI
jgi:hypothetical protein